LTARKAKKLGVLAEVQVTNFVSTWKYDSILKSKSQRAACVTSPEAPEINPQQSSKSALCLPWHVPVCTSGHLPSSYAVQSWLGRYLNIS